jgi:ATP-dependent 26S proteasome regulatory subunit
MLVVTCPHTDSLDDALLRPGRLELNCRLTAPQAADLEAVLRVSTRTVPLSGDVQLGVVAEALQVRGGTCADAKAVCYRAVMSTLRTTATATVPVTAAAMQRLEVSQAALMSAVGE